MAKHTYHWKHGWIPLDHSAALSKAKGDKAAAAKLEPVHPKHLSREKHVTAAHRNGRVALHDRKSGHTGGMSADEAKTLHDTGRHITGVKADGAVDHHSRLAKALSEHVIEGKELKDLTTGDTSASKHIVKGPDGKMRWTPERAALHAKLIEDIFKNAKRQDKPRYDVMGGGPAAGKSTMQDVHPMLSQKIEGAPGKDAALVNADEFKLKLPEYDATPPALAAGHTHEESSYLVQKATDEAFLRSVSLILDGTGDSSAEKLTGKIKAARDAGYSVHGHYITIPTEDAVTRAVARSEHPPYRTVDPTIVRETHRNVSKVFPDVIDKFDDMALWDNSGGKGVPPKLVLEKPAGGKVTIHEPTLYDQFLAKANEGDAPKATPKAALDRGPSSASSSNAGAPAKLEVGQAVSIRGQSNSKVTIAAISPDGQRVRVQNAFETGVKGTWLPKSRVVPHGASTGREAPMGGRAVRPTGITGASIRRR